MERVVYLLGAGFSAPLGYPVMSNFLEKAHDLHDRHPAKYKYFNKVFDAVQKISLCSSYFKANLFDIEEILSILEMQRYLGAWEGNGIFQRFITDLIKSFTPKIKDTLSGNESGNLNWYGDIFGRTGMHAEYGYFISALLNLSFDVLQKGSGNKKPVIRCTSTAHPKTVYSVVTLNYDLVLETFSSYIVNAFGSPEIPVFARSIEGQRLSKQPFLAKLHGSIDTGVIVAPTWNKYMDENIIPEWKMAYYLLSKANHIRIIGYSLPVSDAYIRYLLKSAIIKTQNLKSIDVINRDTENNDVKKLYDEFITFPKYRYTKANTEEYLSSYYQRAAGGRSGHERLSPAQDMEEAHESFMQGRGVKIG